MADRNWKNRLAAASTVQTHVRNTVKLGAQAARKVGGTLGNRATEISDLVAGIEGPAVPLLADWSVGLGQILSRHPKLPDRLRRVILPLDRLGRLDLSLDAIGVDGETVRWEKIDEITFGPPLEVITDQALQNEVRRLAALLPPVPGRRWLVRQAAGVLISLCLAVAGPKGDDAGTDSDAIGIPVSFAYGGLIRRKELRPGVFAALIAALTPTVSEAIGMIADQRGIKVTVAPPSRSHRHAIAMRSMAESMSGRLRRGEDLPAIAGDDPDNLDIDDTDVVSDLGHA